MPSCLSHMHTHRGWMLLSIYDVNFDILNRLMSTPTGCHPSHRCHVLSMEFYPHFIYIIVVAFFHWLMCECAKLMISLRSSLRLIDWLSIDWLSMISWSVPTMATNGSRRRKNRTTGLTLQTGGTIRLSHTTFDNYHNSIIIFDWA